MCPDRVPKCVAGSFVSRRAMAPQVSAWAHSLRVVTVRRPTAAALWCDGRAKNVVLATGGPAKGSDVHDRVRCPIQVRSHDLDARRAGRRSSHQSGDSAQVVSMTFQTFVVGPSNRFPMRRRARSQNSRRTDITRSTCGTARSTCGADAAWARPISLRPSRTTRNLGTRHPWEAHLRPAVRT